jgi:DNA-binding LacI/PurR family transcriptional regulator
LVTMKDIAMLIGVSRQAVSSALNDNNSCRISEEKCKEIKRVARELNYVSNSAARSLKGAPSKTIGFMGPILSPGLNSALINEISQMLIAKGYNILYNDYTNSNFSATEAILSLLARGVDGIVIYNSDETKVLEANQTVPYLFYSHNNHKSMDVGVDNEQGGYLATKHLLEHGHKKVALMSTQSLQSQDPKYLGWRRAHGESGINIGKENIIVLREFHGRADMTIEYLKRKRITAVFAYNDFLGAKLIKILTQRGIKVPEDIAVVGYDGYAFSEFCSTTMTTIIQPIRAQAEFGVELLLERIEKKELQSIPAQHLIKPVLYKGNSCGCKETAIENLYRLNTYNMLEKDSKMNFDIDIIKINKQRSKEK